MLYFSINETLKRWKSTLLIAILIALIMLFSNVLITVYKSESTIYNVFKDTLSREGDIVYSYYFYVNSIGGVEAIADRLRDVNKVYYNSISSFQYADSKQYHIYPLIGVDELMMKYKPKMDEGKWIESYEYEERNVVPVAIINPQNKYKIGDLIEIKNSLFVEYYYQQGYDENDSRLEAVKDPWYLKVCGIINRDSGLFYTGQDGFFKRDQSLAANILSANNIDKSNTHIMAFTQKRIIEKLFEDNKQYGQYPLSFQDFYIVEYKKGISDESVTHNRKEYNKAMVFDIVPFSEMNKRNYEDIRQKIMMFYPIFIALVVLGIISIDTICIITTKNNLKVYGVLYTLGTKWRSILLINMVQMSIACIISFAMSNMIYLILKKSKYGNSLLYTMDIEQILAYIIIAVFTISFSMLASMLILKNNQPMDVIRNCKV